MSIWKINQYGEVEIDIKKLKLLLQTIAKECNIEVVRLSLESLLDELGEK